jgi:hypothetical protein
MINVESNNTVGAATMTKVIIDLQKRKAVPITTELKDQMNYFISK